VRQVGCLQELNRDAQSTIHKILRSPCLRVFLGKQYNCIGVNDNWLLRLQKAAITCYPEALPISTFTHFYVRSVLRLSLILCPWVPRSLFPWHFTNQHSYMYFRFPPFVLHILPFCSTWSWWRNNIVWGVQITKPVLFCPTFWYFHFLRSKL
jgi:hypothetical protein